MSSLPTPAPDPPPPSDGAVLDRLALTDAFVEHGPRLLRYLSRQLAAADAEDVLGETFCTAWNRRAAYRPEAGPLVAWLFGIATNQLRQHKRSFLRRIAAHNRSVDASVHADESSEIIDRVDALAARAALAEGLAALNEDQREVLLLSCWAQLDHAEIAAALDIPLATVRSRLHRARHRLLERLAAFPAPTVGASYV